MSAYTGLNTYTSPGMMDVYPGSNVFWVSSSGANTNPGTRTRPFATVDYAIGRCTANQGDLILVMPGYTETLDGAADWACDVAGVTIRGLGNADQRPQLTMDIAAGITVSAANVTLENLILIASAADLAGPITTTAAYTTVKDVLFRDEGSGLNFDSPIAATGTSNNDNDGLAVINCSYGSPDTGSLNFVTLAKDAQDVVLWGNRFQTAATATVEFLEVAASASVFGMTMAWNFVQIKDSGSVIGLMVTDQSDNTGHAYRNHLAHLDTAGELLATAGNGLLWNENLATGVVTAQGYTLPTIDDNS